MTSPNPSSSKSNSSINLVRSSHSWTQADSAAGFVLRYLSPMRRQLTVVLGSKAEADEALKILLSHLVQAGFGDHKRGRLRDFLVRGVRSCAKARMGELSEDESRDAKLAELTLHSKDWLRLWRECLLERSWRALERFEHANPDAPVYSVLSRATADEHATSDVLAVRICEECGIEIDADMVESLLPAARTMFAQLIADEVVETLEKPSKDDVKEEIKTLGMMHAFNGVAV